MRNFMILGIALIASMGAPASAGISDNDSITAGDALLIGGTQPGWIDVDGQNRGDTDLVLSIDHGETVKVVATVTPGKSFMQSVPKNKVLIIRNASDNQTARVYWHISSYSKAANPRFASAAE